LSKLTVGNPPRDADGVIYDSPENKAHPLHGWRLYRRAASAAPWVSLKLVRLTAGAGSANYWLGWHTVDQRFARTSCAVRIAPELLAAVADVMKEWYPTLTDAAMRDYMAELEAPKAGQEIFS